MKSIKITTQITNRDSKSFEKYLQEVVECTRKQLTTDDEIRLSNQIRMGDQESSEKAVKELVEKNLRFVISVAKQYKMENCPLEDLISEGNYGLIKAAQKFDSSMGFKFISYAVWWIRQSILCYISENFYHIRLPLNKISQLSKIKKVRSDLEQSLNRKPTSEEIIENLEFKISSDDINRMFLIECGIHSLSAPLSNNDSEEDLTFEDLLSNHYEQNPDVNLENDDLKFVINSLVNKLPPKHRLIIQLYYGLTGKPPVSLDEISKKVDLTRERVRQIKNKSLLKLGTKRNFELIRTYIN